MRPAVWLLSVLSSSVFAAEQSFGPFVIDGGRPNTITLNGDIDAGAALNFRRALNAAPKAELVVLNSSGGLVQIALLIADDVHQRKLATYIPKESGCYSACAFIFLAGTERQVDGKLGVHQISSDSRDLISAQLSISDIIDLLNRFETPTEVLTVMFRTPPDEMHVFSEGEVAEYGINRTASIVETGGEPKDESASSSMPANKDDDRITAINNSSFSDLSAIEEYARRPTRMAVYAGLDLFGSDIDSRRTADAVACAKACLSLAGECKAFTYNSDPYVLRGPNCFLKSSEGVADGNAVAISGQLLSGADPDPQPFSMGAIDPKTALFEDIDLPGGDLASRPFRGKITAQGCRLECVQNDSCMAFTYVERKNECWLKGAVGTPRYAGGMISGVKKMQTFAPASIISLK